MERKLKIHYTEEILKFIVIKFSDHMKGEGS